MKPWSESSHDNVQERHLEKETHLYKNSPISLDCDAIANSQQPIDLYKSMICSFLNNYNGRPVEEPKN
jgi:hypothetical protein